MQVRLLSPFTSQLGDTRHGLAFLFTLAHLLQHHLSHIRMLMQVVIHLGLDEVAHIFVHAHPIRTHGQGAQFDLRLTLEHRLLHIHCDGRHDTVTDIGIFEVLTRKLLDGTRNMLLEGTLVRTALGGMLTVDERVVFLAILVGMGEGNLDILPFEMDDGVDALGGHVIVQQILQAITTQNAPAVIHDGKTRVQIRIVAEHNLHDIIMELVVLEQGIIRLEEDIGTILILRILGLVAFHHTSFKGDAAYLPFAEAPYLEPSAQRVHSLHTHTVQAHTLLERLRVVFTTCIKYAYRLHQLSLRDSTTIVAHGNTQVVLDIDLYALTRIHLEFVDRVVDHLLQQHVDTIFG